MNRTSNDGLFESLRTWAVATPSNEPLLDNAPFGVPIDVVINPLRMTSAPFLDRLQRLDVLCFGPEGMPMDKWVFYNCAELPGFIYGFGIPVEECDPRELEAFGLTEDAEGLVPVSVYVAIPMYEKGAWFGHNLSSLNRAFPWRGMHHLASITKAMALKAFRVEHFVGATQWKSNALHIHTRFGALDLDTAYTPAHSQVETLTYSFEVTDLSLRAAMGDPSAALDRVEPTFYLDAGDVAEMKRLQAEIERGARYQLVGRPIRAEGRVRHPILALDD